MHFLHIASLLSGFETNATFCQLRRTKAEPIHISG